MDTEADAFDCDCLPTHIIRTEIYRLALAGRNPNELSRYEEEQIAQKAGKEITYVLRSRDLMGVPEEGLTIRESNKKGIQQMRGIASDALIEQQIIATASSQTENDDAFVDANASPISFIDATDPMDQTFDGVTSPILGAEFDVNVPNATGPHTPNPEADGDPPTLDVESEIDIPTDNEEDDLDAKNSQEVDHYFLGCYSHQLRIIKYEITNPKEYAAVKMQPGVQADPGFLTGLLVFWDQSKLDPPHNVRDFVNENQYSVSRTPTYIWMQKILRQALKELGDTPTLIEIVIPSQKVWTYIFEMDLYIHNRRNMTNCVEGLTKLIKDVELARDQTEDELACATVLVETNIPLEVQVQERSNFVRGWMPANL